MPCNTKIHIRFADIDSMGHVNNATYLSYFEQARMDFFKKNFSGKWDWKTDGIVLVKNVVEYKIPIFLHDEITIQTDISYVGNKSFTFDYEVIKVFNNKLAVCCVGSSTLVSFDYSSNKSKEIPEIWKQKLNSLIRK